VPVPVEGPPPGGASNPKTVDQPFCICVQRSAFQPSAGSVGCGRNRFFQPHQLENLLAAKVGLSVAVMLEKPPTSCREGRSEKKAAMFQGLKGLGNAAVAGLPKCRALRPWPPFLPGWPSSSGSAKHQPKCLDKRRAWVPARPVRGGPPNWLTAKASTEASWLAAGAPPAEQPSPFPSITSALLGVEVRGHRKKRDWELRGGGPWEARGGGEAGVGCALKQAMLGTQKSPRAAGGASPGEWGLDHFKGPRGPFSLAAGWGGAGR